MREGDETIFVNDTPKYSLNSWDEDLEHDSPKLQDLNAA